MRIGAGKARSFLEQIDLVLTPERIEIADNHRRFAGLVDQVVQVTKLQVPMAGLQRQVHEKDRNIIEFKFDDQALDTCIKIMKPLMVDSRRGQERVALLANDRQQLVNRA